MIRRIILCLLFLSSPAAADNATTPTKPYIFSPLGIIFSAQVNADFDALYLGLANIGTANILSSGVGTTQLAAGSVTSAKLDSTTVTAFLVQTGSILDYIGTTAPTGWVFADGKTIGDASSSGTERANADTSTLFALLWASCADAQAAVSTGRGANAAADFAAHKTIALPDLRGRITAGLDNLGGSAASKLTNVATGANFDATVNGNAGGSQSHTLTTPELAAHSHTITDPGHAHNQVSQTGSFPNGTGGSSCAAAATATIATGANVTGITVNSAGSGTAHAIVQPTYVLSKIIKL